ncbi:3'-5' DNA helicase [Rhodotorula sphaerocarpa]
MSDDFSDIEIIDDAALQALDAIENAYANGHALPPRSAVNKPGLVQRDLFGAAIQPAAAVAGPLRTSSATGYAAFGDVTQAKVRLSKRWDPVAFARHGWSKKNAAAAKAKAKGKGGGKGKQRGYGSDEDPWDDEEEVRDDDSDGEEDDDFLVDTSYDPEAPILPIKWPPDENAARTYVYPVQADKPLRAYQLNIIQKALFENTLVSLPTGLGKTFIAAVVMLNFYRWYPKGKVIFLAPTRPLVTQQIKACHYIAGIPQADCVELTGGTPPKLRSVGWLTKRVIYCTPQTVEHDLAKGRLDPRDVTCIVVDEAHRASGDYSYCGVIRYMMCRNPHFRVLALTATPGARGEAVQEVIDNLHIGRVEVRAEDSIDIRQYIHKKSFDLRVLPLGPHLTELRNKWVALMRPYHDPLVAARLVYQKDPVMLSPFAVQQAYGKIKGMPGGARANGKYFSMIKTLAAMARAVEYLTVQSVTSFERIVKDLASGGPKALIDSSGFRAILRETSALRAREGYVGHPKMEMLRSICLEHFKSSVNLVDEYGDKRETRVMIFCNFRAVVEEIVDCLNTQRPLIKATPFVGQASAKGVKGKTQKEQLETIKRFKRGHYNVLVATSIGEEGLDIGEIDLIICYESNKSPIRMLQRVGRTGRARDGHITVLMTEGREEKSWDQANDAYASVQNALVSNKTFDLYVDGERLLPDHIKPAREQVEIKAQPLELEKMTMNGSSRLERKALAEKKEKRKVDLRKNAPDDAFLGFRNAGQIAAAKKEKPPPPSQVLRDRKMAALLSLEEETELRSRWQHDPSGRSIKPQRFDDIELLPFRRNLAGGAHRIPRHGDRFQELISTLRAVDSVSDSKPHALDQWHDRYSKAFDPKLVQVFRAEDRLGAPARHRRLKRYPPPDFEDDHPASFPALTTTASLPAPGATAGSSPPDMRAAPEQEPARPLFAPASSPGVFDIIDQSDVAAAATPEKQASPEPPVHPAAETGLRPAPAAAPMPAGTPDDNYSMLDIALADEELEACIAQAQQRAAAAKAVEEARHEPSEDPNLMPPPPAPVRVASKGFRPAGHALLPSSSPARRALAPAPPPPVGTSGIPAAPMRRLAVPDSSDASSPVLGPRRNLAGPSAANSAAVPDVAPTPTQSFRPLNRLKRGAKSRPGEGEPGELVIDSEGEAEPALEGSEDAPRKRRRRVGDGAAEKEGAKQTKRKKEILTHKQASRFGIFDIEAVNSEASGSEASSEGYASENSIDRDFVTTGDGDLDEEGGEGADASAQAQFYRDSLATQAPPGFGTPAAFGNARGMRWIDRVGKDRRPIALTPGSEREELGEVEDWSYDSFVVDDEEEIVYESSSPARVLEAKRKRRA